MVSTYGVPDLLVTVCLLVSLCSFFFLMMRRALRSTLFPYTTLFRSRTPSGTSGGGLFIPTASLFWQYSVAARTAIDRKSTRLNSSHVEISYAVFCLKKKKYRNKLRTREQCLYLFYQSVQASVWRTSG